MKQSFYYAISVKYNEGYFENPNTPKEMVLGFASRNEQTISSIQKVYQNAKVLKIKEITLQEFLSQEFFVSI
jgi:hypothetical protein